jgi:hypothetical protein
MTSERDTAVRLVKATLNDCGGDTICPHVDSCGCVARVAAALRPRESTRAEIELHLWAAIDLMAATLVKPDERIWNHLLVYRPALTSAQRETP